jgi:hypothetical protein
MFYKRSKQGRIPGCALASLDKAYWLCVLRWAYRVEQAFRPAAGRLDVSGFSP